MLIAVEIIKESLGMLARKQGLIRDEYKTDSDTRDIVECRFVKTTKASMDIGEEFVKHKRGQSSASNSESIRPA